MRQGHKFTSDEKLKSWGYGEWVEEPDEVTFTHNGLDCRIVRVSAIGKPDPMYGGHLCGYVRIPENHPHFTDHYDDIPIEVHGGLTYSEEEKHGYWIGFDCAHSFDYSPSIEYLRNTLPELIKIANDYKELKKKIGVERCEEFEPTYKNIRFAIGECKSMADQLVELKNTCLKKKSIY